MPSMRNCYRCKSLFTYVSGPPICKECKDEEENEFKKLKDYLDDHPGASIMELSTALEINVQKIRYFLKEGRLEVSGDDANLVLECESCGKSIRTGRYCDGCSGKQANKFMSAGNELEDKLKRPEPVKKNSGLKFLKKD